MLAGSTGVCVLEWRHGQGNLDRRYAGSRILSRFWVRDIVYLAKCLNLFDLFHFFGRFHIDFLMFGPQK